MIATLENMRALQDRGVIAYSFDTGEESSANPSDYFWLPEGVPLEDENGAAMVLVYLHTSIVEAAV